MPLSLEPLAWLALLASPASAFWRLPCKSPIVVERTDPIVQPGAVSNHVHTIMGGNGFAPTMDYNSTQASTCSSCTVIGDNSNYWIPALYYQAEDGSFESVDQVGGATVYYLQRGGRGESLKAFPAGFRMVAGNPFKRSGGNDFASQAISYNCLGTSNPETPYFPNYNCPSGLRAQVFFPSCWNGKDLDSPDHKSHMSYPTGAYNNGACPPDFPVHLISLFYEVIWDTNKFANRWYGNKQPFVWAMGDPTGYGGHGDFLMGWEVDHLQRAVDTCTNLSGRVEDCPEFKLIPDSQAQGCTVPSVVDEPVTGKLSKLPGCQTVNAGPAQAAVQSNCGATSSLSQSTSLGFTDLTSQGWAYTGCGTDNYYKRILTGASTSQASMTNDQCVKFCDGKGFSVAGTEYSKECYCGNSIPDVGAPIPGVPGNCRMPCAGDATQMCGGAGPITLYTKCSGSTCTNANFGGPSQVVTNPSTGNGSGDDSSTGTTEFGSPSSTPAESGSGSGTGYGSDSGSTSQPSGNAHSDSSGSGSSGSVSSGSSSSAPPSGPDQPSSGSSSSTPGLGGNPSSGGQGSGSGSASPPAESNASPPSSTTTSPTSATSTSLPTLLLPTTTFPPPNNLTFPPSWTYAGCYTDTVFPRSLPFWSDFNGPHMSNSACMTFCDSRGFPFAGTEFAGQCFCGDGLVGGGSRLAEEGMCAMSCTGGGVGEVCGGKGVLSLWRKDDVGDEKGVVGRRVRRHLVKHAKAHA
ncbi:uncharacterized protein HMPREF1541_04717 [Cyphellophora europaea CBS 101466]|uniref:WSC domain-containing protein n=1 Tax=Cyphellophora europaea (strain CBS 101466) TaxID=1220924 RepID=W2RVV6_CYPE1|nr:uncharacterized protein HMPREF1541_04717 [Cyphellophora europaea CBS 101466]ETN40440.1 hypothetical protein HMPREF1541_04717 [Cyphellophora europaea CBS 101466]